MPVSNADCACNDRDVVLINVISYNCAVLTSKSTFSHAIYNDRDMVRQVTKRVRKSVEITV